MSSDIRFFGQVDATAKQQPAWRAAKVSKAALRGLGKPFRGSLEPFEVGELLDAVAEEGVLHASARALRFAGVVEEGLFWESWGRELAGALVAAAKLGLGGWLWVDDEDAPLRLSIDGAAVVVDEPDERTVAKARRGAAYRLLADLPRLAPEVQAAVDEALDRLEHGTRVSARAQPVDAFEAIVAALEGCDERRVAGALGKAGDVPTKRGLERPKKIARDKAGLLAAARTAEIIEHRALAIEVLALVDPEGCAPHAQRLVAARRTPPAYRAQALRALGRSRSDASLEALVGVVFGKLTSRDRHDAVLAAIQALAASAHPQAASRTWAALPRYSGARGDACFSRAVYVALSHRELALRPQLAAIAADRSSPFRYLAEGAVSCLDGKHTGNFYGLATR